MELKKIIEKNLLDYVGTKTHTGSSMENNNVEFFTRYFERVDYFRNNPENCGFHDIEGDTWAERFRGAFSREAAGTR